MSTPGGRSGPGRCTAFATGIVDITVGRSARLLDVVAGRTGSGYATWLLGREQAWRDTVTGAALDPFRGTPPP